MADRITARNTDAKFTPHPAGQYVARCVDAIDLGEKVTDFPGTPKYLSPKCAIVFRTGEKNAETGDLIDVSAEFTVSMSEKSNLRPFLEGWRGRAYTPDEADAGVPIDKLEGQWALIQVGHKTSGKGRTYAIIMAAMGVPKGMAVPAFPTYERPKFWAERKAEYRKAADQYRAEMGVDEQGHPIGGTEPETVFGDTGDDPSDDLPF